MRERERERNDSPSIVTAGGNVWGGDAVINPMMISFTNEIQNDPNHRELEQSKQTLYNEQKERQFKMRMEARSLDVYRVEDEVEE